MKAGDTVRATKRIWRRDFHCGLAIGKTATVTRVSPGDGCVVVNVLLPDLNVMIDIVVENGVPLEVVP